MSFRQGDALDVQAQSSKWGPSSEAVSGHHALPALGARTAGILLIPIAAVEYGGIFLLSIHRGKKEFTGFQRAFFRAGHAHAGVLLILSLVALLYADSVELSGFSRFAGRSVTPLAAILMPAGFFFSATGRTGFDPIDFRSSSTSVPCPSGSEWSPWE